MNRPQGKWLRFVYKRIVAGDIRKLSAESADSGTGGGARDLRFNPSDKFWPIFERMFTKVPNKKCLNASLIWSDGTTTTTEAAPPTPSRPNEARITRVNACCPEDRLPSGTEESIFILIQSEDGVHAFFMTRQNVFDGGFTSGLEDFLIRVLDYSENAKVPMGFVDLEDDIQYSSVGDKMSTINFQPYFKREDVLAAIRTKPFVLLAGISGTGKSRLVRQLARGCCPRYKAGGTTDHPLYNEKKPGNFEMIQVRPNWHDSTELMGYVTRISGSPKYVLTPFVRFLVKAWLHKDVPFFLCLDEMNLAPVEQYFAEYLSVVETRKLQGEDIVTDVLVKFPEEEILNRALGEISREIPLGMVTKQVDDNVRPKTLKRDKDLLYKLWDEFLVDWPISRLREIGLEEYTKAGSVGTFTYALEVKLANLGSIWGGSAFKFGIFSRDPNGKLKNYGPNSKQIGTNEYAWYRKFGLTKEDAWNTVKEKIVSIAEAAANGDFVKVETIDFPHVVKWKIAFLYQDRKNIKIVDIYKKEWIVLLTSEMPRKSTFADRYSKLNEERKDMDVFEWDDEILTKRRAELLDSDDDFDSDEDEDTPIADAWTQSPVLQMIKKDGGIRIPPNLVVMGTVNMDETTFSFSRKVLDRAMSFELNEVDMDGGLEQDPDVLPGSIVPSAAACEFTQGYEVYAVKKDDCDKIKTFLVDVNKLLDKTPFKIAYRTRNEIMIYCYERTKNGQVLLAQALDEATSMKILSRVEGDKRRLVVRDEDNPTYNGRGLLESLAEVIQNGLKMVRGGESEYTESAVCKKKLKEMIGQLQNGYTSFWTR